MVKKPLSRRQFLQISAVGTVGAVMAACAPQTAPATGSEDQKEAPKAEVVTVSFMGWGGPEEDEGVKSAINQFQSEQSAVKVTWLHTPEQYGEKFLASVAAGTPPDTAFVGSDVYSTYARDGLLLDISNYIRSDPLIGAKDYFIEPQETDRCTYNGKWYGTGSCWVAPHFYYNADTMDKFGVEYPSNDPEQAWDWDTFMANVLKMTVDRDGKNASESGFDKENIQTYGVAWPTWWIPMHSAVISNGGSWTSKETGLCTLDTPEAMEAMQRIYDLSVKYSVAPSDENTQQLGMSTVQMLENGRLAMAVDGSWALSWMYKMEGRLGTGVLPKMSQPGTDMQAHFHSAMTGSKNPEQAWQWVRFLTTPFYQSMFCKIGLWLPSQSALMTKDGLKSWITPGVHPEGYEMIVTKYAQNYGKVAYIPPGWPKASQAIQPGFDQARIGSATVADVMPALVAEANVILADEAKKS
jgi:multiple sugar transport system substrate-binding protein